jgi:polar amino acid transport system substrate-binding protein
MALVRFFLVFLLFLQCGFALAVESKQKTKESYPNNIKKNHLINGWYLWEPYQFNKITSAGVVLTGLDVQIIKKLADRVGVIIDSEEIDWGKHQELLAKGKIDIAGAATYTDERAKYSYFSIPYRFEENSLFVLHDSNKQLDFHSNSELFAQIRLQNFNLGVTSGFAYAVPEVNLFIKDEANRDIIHLYENDVEALKALISGEIDGFLADRMVGAAVVLDNKAGSLVKEIPIQGKTPVHLMFSKKTMSTGLVDKFNREIKSFAGSYEYKNIIKSYLYPVMLLGIIDSKWFYFIGVIGTIAFAISGIAIAVKDNTTLFGTFLFAMVPSVGGIVMRDVLINRKEMGLFLNPSYMYYIIIIVLVGFFFIRLLEYYNERANEDAAVARFWDNVLIIGDAMGQSAFIVTGVAIVIMSRIEPVELWGPFFAFLTANGGGILRDLLRKNHHIICLNGTLNAELSIIWGMIFSIYLDISSYDPDPEGIRNAVVLVAIGAFVTRLMSYYLNVPNLRFRLESKKEVKETVAN